MKLAIGAFQDTKLELFIGHLDIVLPTIPQNEAPKKKQGFSFSQNCCTYEKKQRTHWNSWWRKIVDMVVL